MRTTDEWRVDIVKDGGDWTWNIRDNQSETISPGRHIATVNKYLRDVEYVSNLIAAAPKLLACLDRLAQAAANRENTQGDPCHYLECRAEVRAATAEARELVHNLAVIANGKG